MSKPVLCPFCGAPQVYHWTGSCDACGAWIEGEREKEEADDED